MDYADDNFFQGTDHFIDTAWCTHAGGTFTVRDENFDGRADLVCTNADRTRFVDLADANGRFSGTDFFGECVERTLSSPFSVVAESRERASSRDSGDMRVELVGVGAFDANAETFVGGRGFSNAPNMRVGVSANPQVVSGAIRINGAPLLGYAQAGASIRLQILQGSTVLCTDDFLLNEQEAPGWNLNVNLNRPRRLTCNAEVGGNFEVRTTLRGWASAGGAIDSSVDAHLRTPALSVRECRSR